MPRKLKDTELDTAASRARLGPRLEPYWRRITRSCHLGYRRSKTDAGTWVGRFYDGARYIEEKLGAADDLLPANAVSVLDFDQAQAAAQAWFARQSRRAAGLVEEAAGPYTVAACMQDYLAWYASHRKALAPTRLRIEAHILPSLGKREVAKLTARQIQEWHLALALSPARVRTAKGRPIQTRSSDDPDSGRKRRATANRVLAILRAALNRAYRDGRVESDQAWRRVAAFRSVDAPTVRYLTRDEVVRLCNSCDEDFRQLVLGALLTGCRYGELTALRAGDYNPDVGAVQVRVAKSGKPRYIHLNAEGVTFFEQRVAGLHPDTRLFSRKDGGPWLRSHQTRRLHDACLAASISPVSFHILRHTYASHLAMNDVPLPVIAKQLGHADTRMTMRHYAHLADSYMAEAIRVGLPRFGIVGESKVRIMRHEA